MHAITWSEFLILLVCLVAAMTASRILPLMLLKGRKIPHTAARMLSLIPPAAFAALVVNDVTSPYFQAHDTSAFLVALLAALCVGITAYFKRSIVLCAVVGLVAYILFSWAANEILCVLCINA